MSDHSIRALEIIRIWRAQKYNTEGESVAELLALISEALREQEARAAAVQSSPPEFSLFGDVSVDDPWLG